MVSQTPRDHDAAPDERVALLLAAAAAPAEPGPQPGEEQALAAFRASPPRTRRISMFSTPRRAKLAVASTVGAGAFLFAGVGAAAAGVLPDAAQDTASTWLATLGIEVPNAHAGDHPTAADSDETDTDETDTDAMETESTETDTESETETEADTDATEPEGAEGAEGKGADVSGLATSTESTGVDKGAEISTFASGGKSRAGADHPAAQGTEDDTDADTTADQAPVEHPNGGGTGTATDATTEYADGAAASGTGTADESSSGRSAAGSQNRP